MCMCGPLPQLALPRVSWGPGYGFTARSPAEIHSKIGGSVDPGLGRRCDPWSLSPAGTRSVTIFPLPGCQLMMPKSSSQVTAQGVQVHGHRLPLQVLVGLVQRPEHLYPSGGCSRGARLRPCPNPDQGPRASSQGSEDPRAEAPPWGPRPETRGAFASSRKHPGPLQAPAIAPLCTADLPRCQGLGKFTLFLIIQAMCARWENYLQLFH